MAKKTNKTVKPKKISTNKGVEKNLPATNKLPPELEKKLKALKQKLDNM